MPTHTQKTKEELIIENALLKQSDAITKEFRTILQEALKPLLETQEAQTKINTQVSKEIGLINDRLNKIWVKIWAVAGILTAFAGLIGFFIGKS